jgi:RNA polymerase sigma-70 factor (ECF subfamily)
MTATMTEWSPPASIAGAAAGSTGRDAEVLALLAGGDRKGAISALMDAHGEEVFAFCVRILRDRALAEDVLQRVFLDAHRDIDRFQGRSSLAGWLIGIATHRCQDALKSQRRHRQRVTADAQAMIGFADPGSTPAERVAHTRLVAALEDCLKILSDDVRMAVLLRFQQGKSYDEMSELLDTNTNTLHARVSRALPVLRRCLEGKGWNDE